MQAVTFFQSLVCVILLSGAAVIYAAEQESDQTTDKQSETPVAQQTDDKQQTAGKNPKTKDPRSADQEIFRPSEEISEDFAVSFPVDI